MVWGIHGNEGKRNLYVKDKGGELIVEEEEHTRRGKKLHGTIGYRAGWKCRYGKREKKSRETKMDDGNEGEDAGKSIKHF